MLPRRSSTLQRTQPTVKRLSFQNWQNRKFFLQRLWTLVPGHLSSHSALFSYGFFAPLALWRLSVILRSLIQALGNCPASGAPWSSAMPPSLGWGRVTAAKATKYFGFSKTLNLYMFNWIVFATISKHLLHKL